MPAYPVSSLAIVMLSDILLLQKPNLASFLTLQDFFSMSLHEWSPWHLESFILAFAQNFLRAQSKLSQPHKKDLIFLPSGSDSTFYSGLKILHLPDETLDFISRFLLCSPLSQFFPYKRKSMRDINLFIIEAIYMNSNNLI